MTKQWVWLTICLVTIAKPANKAKKSISLLNVLALTCLQKLIMVCVNFSPFSLTFPLRPLCKSPTFPDFSGEWSTCFSFSAKYWNAYIITSKMKKLPCKTELQQRTRETTNNCIQRRSTDRECGRRRHGVKRKMRLRRLCRESTRQVQSSTELHDADRETGPALLDTSSCAAATFHRLSQSCCREEEPSRSPRHRLHPTVWPGLPDHIITQRNITTQLTGWLHIQSTKFPGQI